MPDEYDEYGVLIKKRPQSQVDEFGITIKKKVQTPSQKLLELSENGGTSGSGVGLLGGVKKATSEKERLADFFKDNLPKQEDVLTNAPIKKNERPFDQTREQAVVEANSKLNEILYGENDDWKDPIKAANKGLQKSQTHQEAAANLGAKNLTAMSLAPTGTKAKQVLETSHFKDEGDNNETSKLLKDRVAKYDKVAQPFRELGDINYQDGSDFGKKWKIYDAAIKAYANKNPQFKKQAEAAGIDLNGENLILSLGDNSSKAAQIMASVLNDEDFADFVKNENPNILPSIKKISDDLIYDNKDYGKAQFANEISRGLQEGGYNNIDPIFNLEGEVKKSGNVVANGLYQNDQRKKQFYEENKDEILDMLDAPSFFQGVAEGGKGVFQGIGKTFTEPFKPISETVKDNWNKEASGVSADPQGLIKYIRDVGHATGLVTSIMATGNVTGIANPKTAGAVATGLGFFGDQLEIGKVKYPDRPFTAWSSALLNTGMYVALSYDLLPKTKAVQAFEKVKPELSNVIENLTAKKITLEQARKDALTIGKKAIDFAGGTLSKSAKIAAEMGVVTGVNRVFDSIGMDDETFAEYHPDDEVAKTLSDTFFTFAPITALGKLGAMKSGNKIVEESLYTAATNPKRFERVIDELQVKDPNLNIKELQGNLQFLVETKLDLDARGIDPKNQRRFLFEALSQKVKSEALAAKPEGINTRKAEEEISKHDETIGKILDGEDVVGSEQPKSNEQTAIQEAIDKGEIKGMYLDMAKAAVQTPEDAAQFVKDATEQIKNEVASQAGDSGKGSKSAFGQTITDFVSPSTEKIEAEQPSSEASPTPEGASVSEIENKIKEKGVDAIEAKDIIGVDAEQHSNKPIYPEGFLEANDRLNEVRKELRGLKNKSIERLRNNEEVPKEDVDAIHKLINEEESLEKVVGKGYKTEGKIKDGIPSFSDMVSFEYNENIDKWKGKVVDIGGTVYAIGVDSKMKPIYWVEYDLKTGKYVESEKPQRVIDYGDKIPKEGTISVIHGSPKGKIEKFDEQQLGKGWQREEMEHERFEGVYSDDVTGFNKLLSTGYGQVHEYKMDFSNSISEKKANKLLEAHEEKTDERLSRKEASKYIKSLGYDMIYRDNKDGTYTYIGLDVNKIKPTNEATTPIEKTNTKNKQTTQPTEEGKQPEAATTETGEGAIPPIEPPKAKPEKPEGKGRLEDKGVLSHLYNADNVPAEAKSGFEREGLKYKTKSQKEANSVAKSVIEFAGMDEALDMAAKGKFDGDVNSLIFAESLNKLAEQEANAKTPEEKLELAKKFAEVGMTYDEAARKGGRFASAINHFYKKSPLGIVMMENAKRAEEFTSWAKPKDKSWKEFFDEMMKEPEFETIVKEQVEAGKKEDRKTARETRKKKVDEFFDKAKDQFKGGATYSTIIPPKIIEAALEGMRKAYHAGEKVVELIEEAVAFISDQIGDTWDKDKFRNEWKKKLSDANRKPLTDEEVKMKVLEKFRKKLSGLSDKDKDEVIRKSYKKIVESGGLDYQDFRDIIGEVTGRQALTAPQVERLKELVKVTNAVDEAATKAREERTPETLAAFRKAEIEAGKASKELQDLFQGKPDILKRLTGIMQLNTLGLASLVNNPIYNILNQSGVRFPVGVVNSLVDLLSKPPTEREYNVIASQAEFWSKLGLGTKESMKQLFTGLDRMDYIQKEVQTQRIRPLKSIRDLWSRSKRSKMSGAEKVDKALQATVGIPAEAVARVLNIGDKPQRFAAEGAQAAAFAKALGLKEMDYKLFIEFPREEAYRAYKAQGLSDAEAGQKADYVKESIIREGQRSTFQQDNLVNDGINALFGKIFGGNDTGKANLVKTVAVSPYLKIPLNAFWSLYNLLNPEIALAQSMVYGARSKGLKSKGEVVKSKMQSREARYWFAHAITGMAARAVVLSLVNSGVFTPSSNEDDSKKERDAANLYGKTGSFHIGGMDISARWGGQWGMLFNSIANKQKDMTPEQIEKQDEWWRIMLGGMEIEALKEAENGLFGNASTLMQAVSSGDFDRYLTNMSGMFTNIVQPASVAQFNRASIDYVPSYRGDNLLKKIDQQFAQRSPLYRAITGTHVDKKLDIWGQPIPKGGNTLSRMFGISKQDTKQFGRPIYEDAVRTGDSGFLPPAVLPTLNGKKLKEEQYRDLQNRIGTERKTLVAPYINDQAVISGYNVTYSQLSDADRKQVLQYLYTQGRELGLEKFYQDYPELKPKEETPDYQKESQQDIFKTLQKYKK